MRSLESNDLGGAAEVGVDLTRQHYLRIVAVRDGSPAAKAGLRPADFIRAIDNRPTRDMSVRGRAAAAWCTWIESGASCNSR